MTLTPRQMWAYLEFSNKLDRIEQRDALWIAAMSARSDGKDIEKKLKELGN